jgi:uncharacterized membrane protein YeaQ/YmgE (transglycosylase-associated protein family)
LRLCSQQACNSRKRLVALETTNKQPTYYTYALPLDAYHRTRHWGHREIHHAGQGSGRDYRYDVIGIVGALIAGFLGRALGWYHEGEPAGFIASIIGAILLLIVYRMIVGRRIT